MPSKSIATKRKRLEDIAFNLHQEINRLDFISITLCNGFLSKGASINDVRLGGLK